jgi:hypothetical protein
MSEGQNNVGFIPNPDGHVFVVCPLEKAFPFVIIIMLLPFLFVRLLDGWMIALFWVLGFFVFWVFAHKLTEAKVNVKLSDIGLEQKRLMGAKQVAEYRIIKWEDIRKCYSYGSMIRIVTEDDSFRYSLPVFTLFVKQKSNRENYYAFEKEFRIMMRKHNIEIRLGK